MNNIKELPEVKSLRWLANMFPFTKDPKDETDRMSNAIHIYCTDGANKIEELTKMVDELSTDLVVNNHLKEYIKHHD